MRDNHLPGTEEKNAFQSAYVIFVAKCYINKFRGNEKYDSQKLFIT